MADARPEPDLRLSPELVETLRARLPEVADGAVDAIIAEVPSYSNALAGHMGEIIRTAVVLALGGFVQMGSRGDNQGRPAAPSMEGAYQLGRGEARSGRTMEALLAAYRVGSRASWRQMADVLVAGGTDAATIARYAELVFAYMDLLSDSSAAGHRDEVDESGRDRQRVLAQLARALLDGAAPEVIVEAAARAEWELPATLTAVLLPEAQGAAVLGVISQRALRLDDPLSASQRVVVLVPDAHRAVLLRAVAGHHAVVGPQRPWPEARASYLRARRALVLPGAADGETIDTEARLGELVVGSDLDALRDLRTQVLAPLGGVSGGSREKLTDTLRAWLLHQGRRDAIAEALFVHPQTVRYRMGQLREAYGDLLDDPDFVARATVALAYPGDPGLPQTSTPST